MQQVQGTNSSHCFCLKAPRVFFSVTNNFLNILHRVKPKILALFRRLGWVSHHFNVFENFPRLVSSRLPKASGLEPNSRHLAHKILFADQIRSKHGTAFV